MTWRAKALAGEEEKDMGRLAPYLCGMFGWACFMAFLCMGAANAPAADYAYHGNRESRIYHNSSCRYFWCKACTVGFHSSQEARAKGFRPCKVCGG